MKIALLTMGTRGDVQPFAVLGKALQEQGHSITLSSAKNFSSLAASYNLNFVPVEADFQEILNSPEGKKMMNNPLSARKHLDRLIYPMLYKQFETFYKVAADQDKILFHVKAMADYFGEKFKGKLIRTNVVPAIEPTKEFVNPVFSSFQLPAFLNKATYKLSDLGIKMMSKPVNKFRQQIGITTSYKKMPLPSLYGISSLFLPKPKDYPANAYYTGFWMDNNNQQLTAEMLSFINAGTPPLLITFGSMPFESNMDLYSVLDKITKKLNTRVIVIRGWGLTNKKQLEENDKIKFFDDAPYDKLLPFVKAVMFHGGIGTIACCLKAGKPFMTCPVLYPLGDQYFWGMIAYKKGIGLKPVALKKMNETIFIEAAKELLTNNELHIKSIELKDQLQYEDGVKEALKLIEVL